ncbi:phosphoadenylyl-sulfate reductase [Salipiger sp. P9]|uniref:phosphoadenylyl-sulfate reductase n=1 Tax=Salipiger pentaromativorans TaxID=2943193 RepID=UPI002157793E|nr:phosphoadenylyl-sulfate reductase [Salipiger pentaromativorans]MCR8547053.1 phosphoadenylyl-sulfate reductase [Salipiger pentaromativorans]
MTVHLSANTPAGGAPARSLAELRDLRERVAALNARYRHHGAVSVLEGALRDPEAGKIALVSSFGAESVVLLHLVALIDRRTPVLFIDTRLLFAETLAYQQEVAERLHLQDVRILRTSEAQLADSDPHGALRLSDTDACCALRKTVPLEAALTGFDGWITGRKRFQSQTRAALDFFELEEDTGRIKVNPLAHWAPEDVRAYMDENRLPRHPLVARGYPSIGCAPCTSPVAEGEDPRAGRWRGATKDECGIHFVNGRMVRQGPST